jgi:hypothetical protein
MSKRTWPILLVAILSGGLLSAAAVAFSGIYLSPAVHETPAEEAATRRARSSRTVGSASPSSNAAYAYDESDPDGNRPNSAKYVLSGLKDSGEDPEVAASVLIGCGLFLIGVAAALRRWNFEQPARRIRDAARPGRSRLSAGVAPLSQRSVPIAATTADRKRP